MTLQLPPYTEGEIFASVSPELVDVLQDFERQGKSLDDVAIALAASMKSTFSSQNIDTTNTKGFWESFKGEFYDLLCTNSSKYESLRVEVSKKANITGAVLLSTLSAAISSQLGLAGGLCTPFVALLLISISRTTKEAWCGCKKPGI